MLVDPEVSPCAGSLAEAADSDVAGMLAEEPASGRLLFDVSGPVVGAGSWLTTVGSRECASGDGEDDCWR